MQNLKIKDYDSVLNWSYNLAKEWVVEHIISEGVSSARKFDKYKRENKYLPKHFPRIPDKFFIRRGTWKGWRDFLGYTEQPTARKSYLSYKDASRIAKQFGIKNSINYRTWADIPHNMPKRPEIFYKDEWENWVDFLGKNYEKGRGGHKKLGETDVRIIKHQLYLGVPGAILAREFKVSEMQISRIKSGENWRDI